jgi:VanZ family protein
MGGLLYLSSLPGSAIGPNTPFWRFVSNASHIPLFAGLGFCLAMTFRYRPWPSRALDTLAIGLAYSIFDEYHQSFIPDRTMSVLDISLDLVGIVLAVWMLWLFTGSQQGNL